MMIAIVNVNTLRETIKTMGGKSVSRVLPLKTNMSS